MRTRRNQCRDDYCLWMDPESTTEFAAFCVLTPLDPWHLDSLRSGRETHGFSSLSLELGPSPLIRCSGVRLGIPGWRAAHVTEYLDAQAVRRHMHKDHVRATWVQYAGCLAADWDARQRERRR